MSESTKIKAIKKEDRSLLSYHPKFSWAIRRIEEISILIIAHIIMYTSDTFNIRTPFARVPKSFISGEGLDAVYIIPRKNTQEGGELSFKNFLQTLSTN